MLKVGNEDVKKIMMGNVEIENIAIGDETIPVESGTPAEPKYYIQISGGTKQELSGGTYEGYINVGSSFWIYADDLDISSALTCSCDVCNCGWPAIYYDTYDNPHHFYTQLPLSAIVVTNNTICPIVADVYLNADGTTYSVPFQIAEPGSGWESDDYLFIPENDIPEDTPITISLDGVNPLEIHWFDQSLEQEMIETAFTTTCVIPAGSYFGFHIEYQPEYSATPYISMDEPLPECGVGTAYIAMYDASVGETTYEELDPNGGTVYYGLTEGSTIEIRKDSEYGEQMEFYWSNQLDGTDGVDYSYTVWTFIEEINYYFDSENNRWSIDFADCNPATSECGDNNHDVEYDDGGGDFEP